MITILTERWWVWLSRGIASVLFGVLAFMWPALTLEILIYLVGAYLLIDGFLNIIAAISHRKQTTSWWIVLLEGLVSVIAGLLAFIWPESTAFILLFIVAVWAILTGILEIIEAMRLRKQIKSEWLFILSGLLSVLFGILLLIWPGSGLVMLVWFLGFYAILFGFTLILLSFKVRKYQLE